jgi:hypothetical protein
MLPDGLKLLCHRPWQSKSRQSWCFIEKKVVEGSIETSRTKNSKCQGGNQILMSKNK